MSDDNCRGPDWEKDDAGFWVRRHLAAQSSLGPVPSSAVWPTDGNLMEVAQHMRQCGNSWEPGARLIGNCRACDLAAIADEYLRIKPALENILEGGYAPGADVAHPAIKVARDALDPHWRTRAESHYPRNPPNT